MFKVTTRLTLIFLLAWVFFMMYVLHDGGKPAGDSSSNAAALAAQHLDTDASFHLNKAEIAAPRAPHPRRMSLQSALNDAWEASDGASSAGQCRGPAHAPGAVGGSIALEMLGARLGEQWHW